MGELHVTGGLDAAGLPGYREARPYVFPARVRKGSCGHPIRSSKPDGAMCDACEDRIRDAELDEELKRIRMRDPHLHSRSFGGSPRKSVTSGCKARKSKGVVQVEGIKLVPASLPSRLHDSSSWDEVVRSFVDAKVPSARVEGAPGRPQSIATSLRDAIKRLELTGTVKVAVRRAQVYLVK